MNVLPDVYIYPLRKKMCTCGTIADSQKISTVINKNGAIAKVRILWKE